MKLELQARGMNHYGKALEVSDVGNFRVCTLYKIPGKDGRMYFLEFTSYDRWTKRCTNKRTGAPLKKPVRELILENALFVDCEFEDDENYSRSNLKLEKDIIEQQLHYTKQGILDAVNYISSMHFDEVEIL